MQGNFVEPPQALRFWRSLLSPAWRQFSNTRLSLIVSVYEDAHRAGCADGCKAEVLTHVVGIRSQKCDSCRATHSLCSHLRWTKCTACLDMLWNALGFGGPSSDLHGCCDICSWYRLTASVTALAGCNNELHPNASNYTGLWQLSGRTSLRPNRHWRFVCVRWTFFAPC